MPEAYTLIGRGRLGVWEIVAPLREPSPTLLENLRRLDSFAVNASEAGKELLIDVLLAEIVPLHPNLRVWKDAPLETDTLTGSADYCLAEMYACRQNNLAAGLKTDVYGIVSNGQGWVFYRWDAEDTEFGRTILISIDSLPRLLGAIDNICAACEAQVVAAPTNP